jgi:hypothetical protein
MLRHQRAIHVSRQAELRSKHSKQLESVAQSGLGAVDAVNSTILFYFYFMAVKSQQQSGFQSRMPSDLHKFLPQNVPAKRRRGHKILSLSNIVALALRLRYDV